MALINKEVIAIKLNNWHLSPRTQNLTELFFTDYRTLPRSLKAGASHTTTFTIHNLEHKTTTYQYSLVASPEDNSITQELGKGTVTLAAERSQVVTETISIPALGERIAIRVNLQYQGVAHGDDAPSLRMQSIHHWVRVDGFSTAASGGSHERT